MVPDDLQVSPPILGGVACQIVSVVEAGLTLEVVAYTPKSLSTGNVAGVLTGYTSVGGPAMISRFFFQYFKTPTISDITPKKATLSGKTTSDDGKSVVIAIQDFSKETVLAGDLKLTFGNIECGMGASCQIMGLQQSKNTVILQVSAPTAQAAGDVSVVVERKVLQPGRQLKRATGSFAFYQPLPVALSARWCSSCVVLRAIS